MECWACFVFDKAAVLGLGGRRVAVGVQGRGKSQKPECMCPLRLYVDQLSLVLSISLSSGILCWCKDFGPKVQEGRFLPAFPFLGQALSCCVFPWAWPVSSSLLAVTFSPGPQRHSCFSWVEGEWVLLLCQPKTHTSCLW